MTTVLKLTVPMNEALRQQAVVLYMAPKKEKYAEGDRYGYRTVKRPKPWIRFFKSVEANAPSRDVKAESPNPRPQTAWRCRKLSIPSEAQATRTRRHLLLRR